MDSASMTVEAAAVANGVTDTVTATAVAMAPTPTNPDTLRDRNMATPSEQGPKVVFNLTPNFLFRLIVHNRNIYHFGNNTVRTDMGARALGEHAASECATGFVAFRVRQTAANDVGLSTILSESRPRYPSRTTATCRDWLYIRQEIPGQSLIVCWICIRCPTSPGRMSR